VRFGIGRRGGAGGGSAGHGGGGRGGAAGAGGAPDLGSAGLSALSDVMRAINRFRRPLAALCAAGAAFAALNVLAPSPPATTAVLAASRDLPAGHVLTSDDLRRLDLPPAVVPAGVLRPGASVLGRTVALPVRRGEALTDVRLVGASLVAAVAERGLVGAPVRIADAAVAALLSPGDRVDVLGSSDTAAQAQVVASDVLVVTVPAGDPQQHSGALDDGALVVLATTPATAQQLAHAATTARLSVVLRG
jgi:Flp pilus assembly protein CpaB